MSGRSIAKRALGEKQRRKIASFSISGYMEDRANAEKTPPTRSETICKCGFRARYAFIRCPECNEVQK